MDLLFNSDPYLKHCEAKILDIQDGSLVLDRTIFYPLGGGQPGDTGTLNIDGSSICVIDTVKGRDHNEILHISKTHFSEDLIGSLKFFARSINGIDEDVRLSNRLFIPSKKLRGFNTYQVGPKDGEDYIGGNYITTVTAEAQLPNILPESYKTDVSMFIDAGKVWSVDYNDAIDDTNKIRTAVGVSANVFTAIGPLSFTLAQDITKSTNDVTETFNFRLGTSF